MLTFAAPVSLTLAQGELLAWHQGRVRLCVLSGTAWVTRPNDPDDHFLHAGQTLEFRDGLISAESALCLRFEAPQAAPARALRALAAAVGRFRPVPADLSLR
jgi:Protein of unknown function (DUF2917)